MNQKTNRVENLIIDMDGVLWHGEKPVPGLVKFFDEISRRQINFVLATNNASNTPEQYAEKLTRFGVAVPSEQILTSAEATASYLVETHPDYRSAYVVGEIGLRKAMSSRGYKILDAEVEDLLTIQADVVVAGMTRHVCYHDLAIANHLIGKGAAFFGTNPDVTFPSEHGPMPGAGSILAFLQTSSGVEPTVIGKPNSAMFFEAIRRLGGSADNTVMVGDRINTDIVGAQMVGLRTVLLLSGIATQENLVAAEIKPDWVFDNLDTYTNAFGYAFPVPETTND
ncbi:MAG TPA: HAD-IIA family hydrolase [candidate division Zixibacteria bacterium]|nr:HAD-IIA family hydrolase [candidate division Zixibacteria bacterium]